MLNKKSRARVGWAVGLGLALGVVAVVPLQATSSSVPWPELSYPPKSEVNWVAQDVTVNGLPMRILDIKSDLGAAEVLAYYKTLWSGTHNGAAQMQDIGAWRAVSSMQGAFNIVVQVKPLAEGAGSEGRISVANTLEARADYFPPSWPQFMELKTLQFMESVDGPRRSYHFTGAAHKTLDGTVGHVKDAFKRKGWQVQQEQRVEMPGGTRGMLVTMTTPGQDRSLDVAAYQPALNEPVALTLNLVQPSKDRR
jgi:hypothetical protein